MKQVTILFTLLLLIPARTSRACPNETVTIGPYHVQTIKGTIEPLGGSTYDELPITFTVQERGAEKIWTVPVNSNGDFLLVLPRGEYKFKIRVEGFLFTLVGTITVDDEGNTEPIAIRPPGARRRRLPVAGATCPALAKSELSATAPGWQRGTPPRQPARRQRSDPPWRLRGAGSQPAGALASSRLM